MIKAIIFDCFGVIIADALQVMRDELYQKDPSAAEELSDLVKATNRGLLDPQESRRRICELLGISLDQYKARVVQGAVKDKALLQYITGLRRDYKIGLLSNVGAGGLSLRFSPEEKALYFDDVVESGAIGHAKPEPQAYEMAAARLGVRPEECVFVDDREPYCAGARGTGMQAVHYRSFGQFKADLQRILTPGMTYNESHER